jgi:flagellar hook protein FlgE
MSELVRMIGVQRGFQATTKALTSVGRLEESLIQSYR